MFESLTRRDVFLENYLTDEAAARFPESDSVLGAGGGQEVVNLAVDVLGAGQVLVTLDLCLDQVVTVDGAGDSNLTVKSFRL